MSKTILNQPAARGLATMFFTTFLAACGGGGGGADSALTLTGTPTPAGQQTQNSPSTPQSASQQPAANSATSAANAPANLGPQARFNSPDGITVAPSGDVYVVDAGNATIRRIAPSGRITTIAGSPGVTGSADGNGSAASFNAPAGIAADRAGNLYVADTGNNTIRKITPSGATITFAGTPGVAGSTDGAGTTASFNQPSGVATDAAGNVYVADTRNYAIRRITPSGTVTTIAGTKGARGTADGGSTASFLGPRAITVDGAGNLYVTDTFFIPSPIFSRDMSTIRRVSPDGTVTTLAGQPTSGGGVTDTDGTGSQARFYNASGITTNTDGSIVYVADTSNQKIRRMTAGGVVDTLPVTLSDGTAARFTYPRGIALDGSGNLYVADTGNHVIRRIAPDGSSVIVAGREGEQGSNDRGGDSPL